MASGNGVSGGSGYSRWNWCAVMDAWEVGRTKTTVTYRVQLSYSSYYAINVHANGRIDGGAGWNGSIVAGGNGYWQQTAVATSDFTVSRTGSAYAKTFSGYVQATGGFGNGTSHVSVSVTVPQREYENPNKPSNVALARKSDTRADLTWNGDYTDANGARPWSNVLIERAVDEDGFVQIATLNWDSINYIDNGISAGHRYSYRLRASNPKGYSEYASAGEIYTTPLAPSSVSIAKISGTTVRVSVIEGSAYRDSYLYQVSPNGGAWGSESELPLNGEVNAGGGLVKIRVGAKKGDLISGYRESNSVTTIVEPSAPTMTGLKDVYALPAVAVVTWTRSHPDGTEQTAAQVEVTLPGGAVETHDVSGGVSRFELSLAAEGEYLIRVRTRGLADGWGAWCPGKAIFAEYRPQVYFTEPSHDGFVVKMVPFTVKWEVKSSSGVSYQNICIKGPSGIVKRSWNLGKDARSFTFDANSYIPDTLTDWTVELSMSDGYSLSAVAARRFRTDYSEPAIPSAVVTTDKSNMSAIVRPLVGATGWTVDSNGIMHSPEYYDGRTDRVPVGAGFEEASFLGGLCIGTVVETARMSVVCEYPDGSQEVMDDDIPSGYEVINRLPPLNIECVYLVTAYSESGTATTLRYSHAVDSDGMEAYNFGQDASTVITLGLDAQCDSDYSQGGEWFDFAIGADSPALPTFYADGSASASGSKSYSIIDVDEFRRLDSIRRDRRNALCWYRDHWGGRHRVKADWRLGYAAGSYGVWSASASVTEVVWKDPVNG